MDDGRLGYGRSKAATVGDLVICVDEARRFDHVAHKPKRFIGLVLDKSITVYKILVVGTGEQIYWPEDATILWKESA